MQEEEKLEKNPKPSKSDVEGFQGGLDIRLGRKLEKHGGTLRSKLTQDLETWLTEELDNQSGRIQKLGKWDRQYRGIKPEKSYPWIGCSNIAIPRTRIDVDAIVVRIFDAIWSQFKLFIIEAVDEKFVDLVPDLEDALEWWQREIAKLKKKLFSPMLQCIKTGLGVVKLDWVSKKKAVYRYASEVDKANPEVKTIKLNANQDIIKDIQVMYEGADVKPVSREDFVFSSDATTMQDAFLVGFKKEMRKAEIETRVNQGLFYKSCLKKLHIGDTIDEVKKQRVQAQGKELKDFVYNKFEIWELWFRYDVDEDGEEDDIVVTYHKPSRTILRAIYNPFFHGFRPFAPLTFYPGEYTLEGTGLCEILTELQDAIDRVFNQRFDRLTQLNCPMLFVRADIGLDDFELEPGKVTVIDGEVQGAIEEFRFSDNYPSTERLEGSLNSFADQAVGIAPVNLGQPTSERPVARETLMLLEETNKKFKFGIDNIRDCISEIGMMVLEFFAQYQPVYNYKIKNNEGGFEKKTINFPLEYLRDGLKVKLRASSEMLNQEIRRKIGLTVWDLVAEYMTRAAGMAQILVNPQMPAEFKKVLIEANNIGVKLMKNILRDFGLVEEDVLVLDLTKTMDTKQLTQPQQPPQPGGAPGQGGAPQPGGMPPQGVIGGQPPQGGMF